MINLMKDKNLNKYIFFTCILLIIYFWFTSNKIPFYNFHIGLGTEFDYPWTNSINYSNSLILKNHFFDFFNSTVLPNYEIGKNVNISPYNIYNPFYFLSFFKLGHYSIFFSTLLTAILSFYSLTKIITLQKVDLFTSIIISYFIITFWSFKFTQDHFQMLSSFHFLFIYLHFFLEIKNYHKVNYLYFAFCFLLAPLVAHIGFVLWIFVPSIIGFAYIKKLKAILIFTFLNLSWLPWLITNSSIFSKLSPLENHHSHLNLLDIHNYLVTTEFLSFTIYYIIPSFLFPMKMIGMIYIPIGLFICSLIVCIILKTYKQKYFSLLFFISVITGLTIYFINTNLVINLIDKSMNRFLFIFISSIIYLFIILNLFILLKKKSSFFWIILFLIGIILDISILNNFYEKKNEYLLNFNITKLVIVIYLFIFFCLVFLKEIKSKQFILIFFIFSLIYPLGFNNSQNKNNLGNDYNDFLETEKCLNQFYPNNELIRIIATGESDRVSRTHPRNYNNFLKYLLDYNNGTNKNYLFKYHYVSNPNMLRSYSKNFNYSYYNKNDAKKFPPSIHSINKDNLFNDFEKIGVDFILYVDSYSDQKSKKLIDHFDMSITPNFYMKEKFCSYQNSKIFIFESKNSFSDSYTIYKNKKKYLKQVDFNKWNLGNKNSLTGDIIIMNTYSNSLKIFNNDQSIPFEEENGFIKILNKDISNGEFKLVYYNSLHRFIFIFHTLIYLFLCIILIFGVINFKK
jgi:hypothetical protein